MARKMKKTKIELTPEEKAVPVQEAKPVISEPPEIEGEKGNYETDIIKHPLDKDYSDLPAQPAREWPTPLSEEAATDKMFSEKTDGKISNELSETPVIEGEQATAPAKPQTPAGILTGKDPKPEVMTTDIPTTKRPKVEPEPEPIEPAQPVICAGCKATVAAETTKLCLNCPGSLRFCPTCAKPGSCHKCGKGLK